MSQDYNNPAFKKLLKKLQEESWQLELLISGFAIFGLFAAYPVLEVAYTTAQNDNNYQLSFLISVSLAACSILIFNLLLHVLLRGLWIGALGLRYVSGDIDYDALNYSEKFSKYLKKNVGSFDKYIARLENYCSIIFAISFLLIFYVIAIAITNALFAIITIVFLSDETFSSVYIWFGYILVSIVLIGMIFTFIDFITLGYLKKKKWTSRIYFPIYWCFSYLTLSFLYRPLVYNFLDNKFGRRLSFFLVPVYIMLITVTTLNYNRSNYFNFEEASGKRIANSSNYEDQLIDASDLIEDVAINKKVVSNNYMKVFVVFKKDIEDDIYKFNSNLKPEEDNRGIETTIINIELGEKETLIKRDEFLDTFNSIYSVQIDSVTYKTDFVIGTTVKNQKGFETYIGIKNLKEGKHILSVNRNKIKKSDTIIKNEATIPFWYYPD